MSTKRQQSLVQFEEGFNCCQSIVSPYAEQLGLDLDSGLRLSSGFGAGICPKLIESSIEILEGIVKAT